MHTHLLAKCLSVAYQGSASGMTVHEKGRGIPAERMSGYGAIAVDRGTGWFGISQPAMPIIAVDVDGQSHDIMLWPRMLKKRLPIDRMSEKIAEIFKLILPPTVEVEQVEGHRKKYYVLTEQALDGLCGLVRPILEQNKADAAREQKAKWARSKERQAKEEARTPRQRLKLDLANNKRYVIQWQAALESLRQELEKEEAKSELWLTFLPSTNPRTQQPELRASQGRNVYIIGRKNDYRLPTDRPIAVRIFRTISESPHKSVHLVDVRNGKLWTKFCEAQGWLKVHERERTDILQNCSE